MWDKLCVLLLFLLVANASTIRPAKPSVDPGLFMIMGVKSCREGSGYCLMGIDCTLDDDFLPDDSNGHCNGLKSAFTPSAHFTCCKYNVERGLTSTTRRPRPGMIKTTTTLGTTPDELATTSSSISVTPEVLNDEATTVADEIDVFVDVNNEVIKEVVPPVLQKEEISNSSQSNLKELQNSINA